MYEQVREDLVYALTVQRKYLNECAPFGYVSL